MATGTLELLARELSRSLRPLGERLRRGDVRTFLAELGIVFPPALDAQGGFTAALEKAAAAGSRLEPLGEQLASAIDAGNVVNMIKAAIDVIDVVRAMLQALDAIGAELRAAANSLPGVNPAVVTAFAAELPARIVSYCIVEHVGSSHPVLLRLLVLLGIAELKHVPGDPGNPSSRPHTRRELRLDRIGGLLQSPETIFKDIYSWNAPGFDGRQLLESLKDILFSMHIPCGLAPQASPPELRLFLMHVRPRTDVSPPGMEAVFEVSLPVNETASFPIFEPEWTLEYTLGAELDAQSRLLLQPPANLSFIRPSGTAQGNVALGIGRGPKPGRSSISLLGVPGGSGLEAQRFAAKLVADFKWDAASSKGQSDFGFDGEIKGGKLRVALDGADGFLGKILSGINIEADFDLGFGWRAGGGVYFSGSSALEIQLPAHVALGPIELNALTLRIGIENRAFPISLAADIRAMLGPLSVTVEQIGARAELSFPADGKGKLGPADFHLAFKPPKGLGLALDAGPVKGGGYLSFDADKEEYAGALELVFSGFLTLKAIGLITTKMPDGSKGFSLLIIITAEFGTGIQLGFGFTLLGVGGLIGLNRTMRLQPLAEGIRTGAVNGILFPRDVIKNAPRIISDLRTIFPPQEGRFLIGPMAKLGWGTPTLVSLSLGIIIEIPGNIAILGVLRVALPADDIAVIVLQVNFIGAIEFDKARVWFFAALFDSRILFITLSGELGVLVAFGDDANLVLAVGGFHPRFTPPPLPFPVPRRLCVSIIDEPFARIRLDGYFAVTSNSVQFGAHADANFGFDDFGVEGHLGLDALIVFSPFHFVISVSSSFSLKIFGAGLYSVGVSFQLEGPTPWRVQGTGTFSILFIDIDVDFDFTWGDRIDTSLPPIAALPIVAEAFSQPQNWRARLPDHSNLFVTLRPLTDAEAGQVLHPAGTLQVRQKALPLDLTISKVGNQKVADVNRITVKSVTPLIKFGDLRDQFAPAQYQDLDDAARLSRPSYETENSGLELSSGTTLYDTSGMTKRSMRYELILIDTTHPRPLPRFQILAVRLFEHWLQGNCAATSVLSQRNRAKSQPFSDKIQIDSEGYSVVYMATKKPVPNGARFHSEGQARDFVRALVAKDANQKDKVHVVPEFEVSA